MPWGWMAAAILLVGAVATPVVTVVVSALGPSGGAWSHIASNLLPEYLAHTAVLGAIAGGVALVLGVGSAWLVTMCEFPGRRHFRWALVLPLAVPAYIAAFTYAGMVDVTGPLQRAIRAFVPGASDVYLNWNVMRIEVVAVIFGLVLYPYVYLPVRALLEWRAGAALEAARLLGREPRDVFLRVALPLARPAVAGGMALVMMEVLNDYGAVAYYGVTTFTTGIFRAWFSLGDLDSAVRLAVVLLVVVAVVLALERWQRGGARYHEDGPARTVGRYRLDGRSAAAATAFCSAPLALGFGLPVTMLAWWSARTAPEVVDAGFLRLALHSFGLAGGAGALAVAVALVLCYAGHLDRTRLTRSIARVAVLGYSVPGAVIAVGVLLVTLVVDRGITGGEAALVFTGSLTALVFAYVVRFMAVAYLPTEAGFERVGREPGEAAHTLGASPLRALIRVEIPLLRGALLAAATLVVIDVLKELPITLILRPFDFDTLATRAFQLASDEQVAEAAPAALLVILAATGVAFVLHRTFEARRPA